MHFFGTWILLHVCLWLIAQLAVYFRTVQTFFQFSFYPCTNIVHTWNVNYNFPSQSKSISGHPGGPYRAVEVGGDQRLATSLFEDCITLDDLLKRAVQLYSSYKCLGTRDLLSEEDEMQSNGKVFKKVLKFK